MVPLSTRDQGGVMKKLPVQKSTLAILAVLIPLLVLLSMLPALRAACTSDRDLGCRGEHIQFHPRYSASATDRGSIHLQNRSNLRRTCQKTGRPCGRSGQSGAGAWRNGPVDLDERIRAQDAAVKRAKHKLDEAQARQNYAHNTSTALRAVVGSALNQ